MTTLRKFSSFFHPERFQGWGKKRNYFEGWYFKVLNHNKDKAFAFIPGIAFDSNGNGHSFVQVLDGKTHTSRYHRFDCQDFMPSEKSFEVRVAGSFFSSQKNSTGSGWDKRGNAILRKCTLAQSLLFARYHGPFFFCPFYGVLSWDCEHGPCHPGMAGGGRRAYQHGWG